MANQHTKSGPTVLLDLLRNLLILAATAYLVFLIWQWSWIVALVVALPLYVVVMNIVGFATLPIYAVTPENRLRGRAMRAMLRGDKVQADALMAEFARRFNVTLPSAVRDDEQVE